MKGTPSLNVAAGKLLESMQLLPPREPGEKLRAADEAKILELHAQGVPQTDIARAVACHQSTVSRTLAEYDDSRPLARKYLESRALEMTKRLVTDARPETILKVLAKLDVVRDDGVSGDDDDGYPKVWIGIGVQMGSQQDIHAPGGATGPGLFLPDDRILLLDDPVPQFASGTGEVLPRAQKLFVQRKQSPSLYDLPCDVTQIPTFVKTTPEAAQYIRRLREPAIEAVVVSENGGHNAEAAKSGREGKAVADGGEVATKRRRGAPAAIRRNPAARRRKAATAVR